MSDHLLPETLVEIFLKLPIETLVRCTCTCKLWNSIIRSQSFIALHQNHSLLSNKNKRSPLLVRQVFDETSKEETFSICLVNDDDQQPLLAKQAEIQFPYVAEEGYFRVSSINGVLLLCCGLLSHTEKYILYNPSVRKHLVLPYPNIDFDSFHYHVIAFGYSAKTSDYKVLRIVYLEAEDGFNWYSPHLVQIYSLNAGAWHDAKYVHAPCYLSEQADMQACVNGFIHFIAGDIDGTTSNGVSKFLLAFNLDEETFSRMKMPGSCSGRFTSFTLGNFRGCLSLIQYDRHDAVSSGSCTIWVMKEYGAADSWTKLHELDQDAVPNGIIIGMLKMDELLIMKNWYFPGTMKYFSYLVLYNTETRKSSCLGVSSIADSLYQAEHVESLVGMSIFSVGESTRSESEIKNNMEDQDTPRISSCASLFLSCFLVLYAAQFASLNTAE